MKKYKEKGGISQENLALRRVNITGNKMSDNLFYVLAHTPLNLSDILYKSGNKIVVCLSRHDFQINGYNLVASGLLARNTIESARNIKEILDQYSESIALVSQKGKKYFDKETLLQDYKARIFCLLPRKKSRITNKPYDTTGLKIRKVLL